MDFILIKAPITIKKKIELDSDVTVRSIYRYGQKHHQHCQTCDESSCICF